MKKTILYLLVAAAGIVACKKENAKTEMINDAVTNPISDTLGAGNFIGQDHGLSGNVILYKDNTNNHILRLENFNMTSAPDADVLLSKTENYNSSNVIKVLDFSTSNYTNSSINIDVPENIDFSQYPYVIVWCTQYSAYFGHAPLQ